MKEIGSTSVFLPRPHSNIYLLGWNPSSVAHQRNYINILIQTCMPSIHYLSSFRRLELQNVQCDQRPAWAH
jgi:hypothetical protein